MSPSGCHHDETVEKTPYSAQRGHKKFQEEAEDLKRKQLVTLQSKHTREPREPEPSHSPDLENRQDLSE